jgi:hypothetical protein
MVQKGKLKINYIILLHVLSGRLSKMNQYFKDLSNTHNLGAFWLSHNAQGGSLSHQSHNAVSD